MGDVIFPANLVTTLDLPPDRVLTEAIKETLNSVLVIGKYDDGKLYLAASTGDGGEIALLIMRGQQHLIHHVAKQFGDPL